jgi:DNA-binding beta-propeller fold protein YncE
VDWDDNVIVADRYSHDLYSKVTPQGQLSTLAGGCTKGGYQNGERDIAQFNHPTGVAIDGDGNVLVTDTNNHRIRIITPPGDVSTLAGTVEKGHNDGEGAVAQFNYPTGIAVDGAGDVLVADTYNHRICKITPQGQVSTLSCSKTEPSRNRLVARCLLLDWNIP